MKISNSTYSLLLTVIIMAACSAPVNKNKEPDTAENVITGIEAEQRFAGADSLVFVFYKDPYGADSLRYTRYYTQYSTTDSKNIKLLHSNLEAPFVKLEKIKNCRSEGKIWCYSKGSVFQTVYFSTRCADCCFLYFIKDGFFFYMKINDPVKTMLASIKPLSKESISK